jgi:Mn-dependent DtxR family transcriptional regulator
MRPRIDWMTRSDDRTLEFLDDKEIVASASVIAVNIDYNPNYISRRCRRLAEAGLIQRIDSSNYRLTDVGERYLSGEIDPDELEIDDDEES